MNSCFCVGQCCIRGRYSHEPIQDCQNVKLSDADLPARSRVCALKEVIVRWNTGFGFNKSSSQSTVLVEVPNCCTQGLFLSLCAGCGFCLPLMMKLHVNVILTSFHGRPRSDKSTYAEYRYAVSVFVAH